MKHLASVTSEYKTRRSKRNRDDVYMPTHWERGEHRQRAQMVKDNHVNQQHLCDIAYLLGISTIAIKASRRSKMALLAFRNNDTE